MNVLLEISRISTSHLQIRAWHCRYHITQSALSQISLAEKSGSGAHTGIDRATAQIWVPGTCLHAKSTR